MVERFTGPWAFRFTAFFTGHFFRVAFWSLIKAITKAPKAPKEKLFFCLTQKYFGKSTARGN
jgi:hypothetical protein